MSRFFSCGALTARIGPTVLHPHQSDRPRWRGTPCDCRVRLSTSASSTRGDRRKAVLVPRSGGDDTLEPTIRDLAASLERAIDDEEYELAASIRDRIERKRQDSRLAVEEANEKFYGAFRNGDYVAMSKIWGTGEHVQCIHPVAECIAGREDVLKSWQLILSGGRLDIQLEDVRVYATDTAGYATLVEVVNAEDSKGRIIATNVFERQGSEWKIVLHQGGPAYRT